MSNDDTTKMLDLFEFDLIQHYKDWERKKYTNHVNIVSTPKTTPNVFEAEWTGQGDAYLKELGALGILASREDLAVKLCRVLRASVELHVYPIPPTFHAHEKFQPTYNETNVCAVYCTGHEAHVEMSQLRNATGMELRWRRGRGPRKVYAHFIGGQALYGNYDTACILYFAYQGPKGYFDQSLESLDLEVAAKINNVFHIIPAAGIKHVLERE
jgi:hypothetical protein